jgi:hypothetical protein
MISACLLALLVLLFLRFVPFPHPLLLSKIESPAASRREASPAAKTASTPTPALLKSPAGGRSWDWSIPSDRTLVSVATSLVPCALGAYRAQEMDIESGFSDLTQEWGLDTTTYLGVGTLRIELNGNSFVIRGFVPDSRSDAINCVDIELYQKYPPWIGYRTESEWIESPESHVRASLHQAVYARERLETLLVSDQLEWRTAVNRVLWMMATYERDHPPDQTARRLAVRHLAARP